MIKWISWAAIIVWMAIIFYLSHEPASTSRELSTGLMNEIFTFIGKIAPASEIDAGMFHHLLRKSAHFFAYSALGIFSFAAFLLSGASGYRRIFMALGLCVMFAISDEVHQLFVPGRSGEIRDVLIDSAGAGVGIGVALLVKKIVGMKRKQRLKTPESSSLHHMNH